MQVEFKNSLGRIVFGKDYDLRIIDIDGLALAPKIRNTASYAGILGEYKLSESVGARTITLKGDLKLGAAQNTLTRMIRILNQSGTLTLHSGSKRRCIEAECIEFDTAGKNAVYQPFILQFICDYPYFSDTIESKFYVFEVSKLLKTQFTLPCMFSKRIHRQTVQNGGDIVCEPRFEITALGDSDGGGITIENTTIDRKITLNYKLTKGEVITVDIEKRKITSDKNADIIYSLDDDSYLSDFWLKKGKNVIVVTNGSGGEISAVCRFFNKYIEAVV